MIEQGGSQEGNTTGFEDNYSEELTQESFKELQRLAFWSSRMGPEFYLIGGWAAWYYHRGLGSRDIDVVFPDKSLLDSFLQTYYKQNGYECVAGLLNKRFRKRVMVGGRAVFVEIDAASMDEGPPLKEDSSRNLPFTALEKFHGEWQIGQATIKIPLPELLILMKVKAHRDRSWTLDHEAVSPVEIAYLRGKIWKDGVDIRNLTAHIKKWNGVWKIAKKYDFDELAKDTFRNLRLKTNG